MEFEEKIEGLWTGYLSTGVGLRGVSGEIVPTKNF